MKYILFFNNIKQYIRKYYNNKFIHKIIYALVILIAIMLNVIRIFNSDFWGDECFSIKLAKMPILDLIKATSIDVHPPLYYMFLRFMYLIFGNHGYTYHLASIIPVIIAIIFSATVVKKRYGCRISILFILLQIFMVPCFTYNFEVRMYSMANLLVLLCFWYGNELIQKNNDNKRNWFLFTLFGILAAYTHYYALIAVFFIYLFIYFVLFYYL